ncbi:MAG: RidA family protein [Hymenobacteraceae bacterium]|nr:RidA family protein [Hymenobacteraceae bacterium]
MRIIQTENMPPSNGHYAQVMEHNGVLYLSGQLPINPQTKEIPETIEEQAAQALANVEKLLQEAGSSRTRVLKATVYIADIHLWDKVNAVYADFFGTHKPARSIVPTQKLHFGSLIEIEVIAALIP